VFCTGANKFPFGLTGTKCQTGLVLHFRGHTEVEHLGNETFLSRLNAKTSKLHAPFALIGNWWRRKKLLDVLMPRQLSEGFFVKSNYTEKWRRI